MRMIHDEYYDEPEKRETAARKAPAGKATVVYPSVVAPKAYGGYGAKNAGASVGLPSVMPNRSATRKPSHAKRGGGDGAIATTLEGSWGNASQRRYKKN